MHDTLLITVCQFLILEEIIIQVFGKVGSGENEFKQPSVNKLGIIYVSDFDNGQLIVFQ